MRSLTPFHSLQGLVIGFLLIALLAPATAAAQAIPNATYEGPISGGGRVRFHVSSDGEHVTSFRAENVPDTFCEEEYIEAIPGGDGYPISYGSFSSYPLDFQFRFHGEFPSYQQASGTLSIFAECITGSKSWTASTTATPPPPPPPLPPTDTTPPALTFEYRRTQRLSNRAVVVGVRCSEACRLEARGVAWPSGNSGFGLGTKQMVLEAGALGTLTFKLKGKVLAATRKAHHKGRRTQVMVSIEASDMARRPNRTEKSVWLWIK